MIAEKQLTWSGWMDFAPDALLDLSWRFKRVAQRLDVSRWTPPRVILKVSFRARTVESKSSASDSQGTARSMGLSRRSLITKRSKQSGKLRQKCDLPPSLVHGGNLLKPSGGQLEVERSPEVVLKPKRRRSLVSLMRPLSTGGFVVKEIGSARILATTTMGARAIHDRTMVSSQSGIHGSFNRNASQILEPPMDHSPIARIKLLSKSRPDLVPLEEYFRRRIGKSCEARYGGGPRQGFMGAVAFGRKGTAIGEASGSLSVDGQHPRPLFGSRPPKQSYCA